MKNELPLLFQGWNSTLYCPKRAPVHLWRKDQTCSLSDRIITLKLPPQVKILYDRKKPKAYPTGFPSKVELFPCRHWTDYLKYLQFTLLPFLPLFSRSDDWLFILLYSCWPKIREGVSNFCCNNFVITVCRSVGPHCFTGCGWGHF